MPALSLIDVEAQHLLERLPANRRSAMQVALVELCKTHWWKIRGPQPENPLKRMLWLVTPPLADLLVDLYSTGETRIAEYLPGGDFSRGMALLALAEIECGNEFGARIAHEPMMAFETSPPSMTWCKRISALLHGTLEEPCIHPHDTHPPLWKALLAISIHIKRTDLPAIVDVIRLLTAPLDQRDTNHGECLKILRNAVLQTGIHILRIHDDHIAFEQHGHEHKSVRIRQLGDMLLEIRQMWLR